MSFDYMLEIKERAQGVVVAAQPMMKDLPASLRSEIVALDYACIEADANAFITQWPFDDDQWYDGGAFEDRLPWTFYEDDLVSDVARIDEVVTALMLAWAGHGICTTFHEDTDSESYSYIVTHNDKVFTIVVSENMGIDLITVKQEVNA